jgi:hypothetical protein
VHALFTFALPSGSPASPAMDMNIMTAVMTYGADAGGMLASLVALATLCLSLRRPCGKHHKGGRS